MNKIQTWILIFLLTSLLSGCLQQGSTYSNNNGDENRTKSNTQPIIWGKETKQSIYLDPKDYVKHDPLGKQQMKYFGGIMIKIPSGSFQMGSNTEKHETPVHRVHIKAFKLARYEVTQKQWQAVMGDNPSKFKNCDCCQV